MLYEFGDFEATFPLKSIRQNPRKIDSRLVATVVIYFFKFNWILLMFYFWYVCVSSRGVATNNGKQLWEHGRIHTKWPQNLQKFRQSQQSST